jgi:hypothetical protein
MGSPRRFAHAVTPIQARRVLNPTTQAARSIASMILWRLRSAGPQLPSTLQAEVQAAVPTKFQAEGQAEIQTEIQTEIQAEIQAKIQAKVQAEGQAEGQAEIQAEGQAVLSIMGLSARPH